MKNGISPVSLRPGKIPFIRPTYIKISRCMTAFINVAVLRFCFIFWARLKFEFVEKNWKKQKEKIWRTELEHYLFGETRKGGRDQCWMKEGAGAWSLFLQRNWFRWRINMYSEKAWTRVNFKVTKDCSPFQLAGKDLNLRPDEIRRIIQIFTWFLLHWEVMFKSWL